MANQYTELLITNPQGLVNVGDTTKLDPESQAVADNITFTGDNFVYQREGRTQVATGIVDVYTPRSRNALYQINSSGSIFKDGIEIGSVPVADEYVWCDVRDTVYILCAQGAVKVKNGRVSPWGYESVTQLPNYTIGSGDLPRGRYKFSVVFSWADHASSPINIGYMDLPDNDRSIVFTNIPTLSNATTSLLITRPNGTRFVRFDNVGNSFAINSLNHYLVGRYYVYTGICLGPDLNAVCSCWFNKSIWIAIPFEGETIIVPSLAAQYDRFNYNDDEVFIVPGTVQALSADTDTLYIATENTIYRYKGQQLRILYEFGVPIGLSSNSLWGLTADRRVIMYTHRGPTIMGERPQPEARWMQDYGYFATSVLDERHGLNRFISCYSGEHFRHNQTR